MSHAHQLAKNAAEDPRQRFDLNRQVEEYLGWYEEILEHGIQACLLARSEATVVKWMEI